MVRGGKGRSKRGFKKRIKGDKGSDGSDEDYVVSDEQSDASDDASEDLAGSASEDGVGEFLNDEVPNEDDGGNDDDLVEEEEEYGEEDEEDEIVKPEGKRGSSDQRKSAGKTSRIRSRFSVGEESDDGDEDYDANDDDDGDDEEFTPDEDECLDDEEDSMVKKRSRLEAYKKLGRRAVRKNVSKKGQTRRKKSTAPKTLSRKKDRKIKRPRKKARFEDEDEDDGDFADTNTVIGGKARTTLGRSRRRHMVRSDSYLASSGSSDFDYTISEEEREQVREANEICGNLTVTPPRRSSSSSDRCTKGGYLRLRRAAPSRKTEENAELPQQRKSPGLKGKQKVEEVVKQVCGICLSEDDKRRVRGTLNCCSHYFCFTCIMEWSKVESRCPLCKQRFKTISKPARSAAGVDLREVLVQVPERDQVYQPSEEEIRGYLDPYENVICTECHQGGDDGLMLLCDICDSPAHTFCVGLGREVPEGNWYCEGCRPGALGSSSSRPQDPTLPDQRMRINGSDALDLNVPPSPLPYMQGIRSLASPRFNGLINQVASPFSGAGATTVSGRRWIQRHIHQILIGHRASTMASRIDGISPGLMGPDQLNSHIDQSRQAPVHHSRTPEIRASLERIFGQNTLRRHGAEAPTAMPPSNTSRAMFYNSSIPAPEQLPQTTSSRSSLGSEIAASAHAVREESHFYRAKEQVQSMVRNHLKSIAKDVIGHDDFKDITRSCTHTILAACGLDHRKSEVHTGPLPPPPLGCLHPEIVASGQSSPIKGVCSACFDVYVRDVVGSVVNTRSRQWLSLGL